MKKQDVECTVTINIIDNEDWQPDLDFFIQIYDPMANTKLYGDDTECKVTILDEDFPGKLGFDKTEIVASRN